MAVGLLTRRVAVEAEDYLLKACFMLTYHCVCAGGDGVAVVVSALVLFSLFNVNHSWFV